MLDFNRKYWDERAIKYGHTGWSDYAIYYYDQNLRLKTIDSLLKARNHRFKKALDFGCGTGDFTSVLAKYAETVVGIDVSSEVIKKASKAQKNENVQFKVFDPNKLGDKYDLILCITVLQHVVDENALRNLLLNFRASLTANGEIIVMETFWDGKSSNYMRQSNRQRLIQLFQQAGLVLHETFNFYHPINAPTALFLKYRNNMGIKLLRVLSHFNIPLSRHILRNIARDISAKDTGIVDGSSMTQILTFEAVNEVL